MGTQPSHRVPLLLLLVAPGLLAGCPGTGATGRSPGPAAKARPAAPSPDATAASSGSTLSCDQVIDAIHAPPDGRVVAVGAVAVPGPAALQVGPSGETAVATAASARSAAQRSPTVANESPALRLFAKSGLVVRADSVVELRVPAGAADRLRIGWGTPGRPGLDVRLEGCADRSGWLVFAGGYWVDEPGCLPLTVRSGGREEEVRIGVGVACPSGS